MGSSASSGVFRSRIGVQEVFPGWFRSMFLGEPKGISLRFADETKHLSKKHHEFVAPMSWLNGPVTDAAERRETLVEVALPQSFFLRREIPHRNLPKRDREKAIVLNTLQETPFSASDISFVVTKPQASNSQSSIQWIAKKTEIERIAGTLRRNGFVPLSFEVEGVPGAIVENYKSSIKPGRTKAFRALNAISAMIIAGSLSYSIAMPSFQKLQVTKKLESEIAALSRDALQLRQQLDEATSQEQVVANFEKLVSERVFSTELLVFLTDILPDDVWLTDISYNQSQATIRGSISGSAAQLLLSLPRNAKFANPAFVGPISKTAEGRERFDLRFKIGSSQ